MSEHAAPDDGDFLDSGMYPGPPPYAAGSEPVSGASRWKAGLRPVAWLAAGAVAGAVAVAGWHSSQSSTTSANPAAAQRPLGNGPGGPGGPGGPAGGPGGAAGPSGQGAPDASGGQAAPGGPGGPGAPAGPGGQAVPGGPGRPGGPGGFGGRTGEQRVQGTVTAVGTSTVTVRLAGGGTATYTVTASSDIVKDGARVGLSAVKAGDAVFLHVYPQNGKTVVEHLFAGPPPPDRHSDDTQSDDRSTGTDT